MSTEKPAEYFSHLRPEIVERVPHWAKTVLDVGCGAGTLGAYLKKLRPDRTVIGVEIDPSAAQAARAVLDRVLVGDVSHMDLPAPASGFDVIICADVLEHLPDPWRVLRRLIRLLSRRGQMIVSLPNLRNILELARIASGDWQYDSEGIFDRTHLRFFTPRAARQLLAEAGLRVHEVFLKPDARLTLSPSATGLPQDLAAGNLCLLGVSNRELREIGAFQIVLVASRGHWPRAEGDPQVSIIIPHWNRLSLLVHCLSAIRATAGDPTRYEILVVDNGSDDGSREFLQRQPDVRLLWNPENIGFTLACNQGAEAARGQYLVFLNNDTEPRAGWLDALLQAAEDESVGAVGAKLLYPDGSLQEAGSIVFADGSGWNWGRGASPEDPAFNRRRDVDYCSAAALLVKAEAFWAAGAFDPRYAPAYYEDTDLCFSLRRHGWRVVYEPRAVVLHKEGGTAGRDTHQGLKRYQLVNQRKFVEKWALELERQYPPSPEAVARAAERVPPLSVLFLDVLPPVWDQASGSQRLFQLVRLTLEEGHRVAFFATELQNAGRYLETLRRMGVRVGHGQPGGETTAQLADLLVGFRPDVVWLEGYSLVPAFEPVIRRFAPSAAIVCDTLDLHFLRTRRLLLANGSDSKEWQVIQAQELAAYRRSDHVVAISGEEAHLLRSLGIQHVSVLSNVHEPLATPTPFAERRGLLFVGNFNHPPNADGLVWFLDEIWPKLVRQAPDLELTVVGAGPTLSAVEVAAARARRHGGVVRLAGRVPHLLPLLSQARVSIAPLRAGAGVKGKVLEAFSAGLPVVTTSVGAEGIGIRPEQEALVADDPDTFAEAVLRLLTDESLWTFLRQNALRLVADHYSTRTARLHLRETLLAATRVLPARSAAEASLTSIVIPCRNGVEVTRQCITSIFRNTPEPFELILVDNGSNDATPSYFAELAAKHRNVHVIRNAQNTGFAFASNQGAAQARGKQVLFLNNDVVVPPGWLRPMISALDRPGVGLVGPRSNSVSGVQMIPVPYGDDLAGMEAFAWARQQERSGEGFYATRAVGFCLLVRRDVLERIGGFDVAFGMGNFEDDDFCARAQLAGYRIFIADDAFVHHFGSHTFARENVAFAELMQRNAEVLAAKWFLPEDWDLTKGIPYGQMLASRYHPRLHYCPLTPQEVATANVQPLAVQEARGFRLLAVPDWQDPRDRWLEAVRAFYALPSRTEATLLLRIDPLTVRRSEGLIQQIQETLQQAGLPIRPERPLVLLNNLVPPADRAAVYRAAHAFIDTAPPGTFRYTTVEAKAVGLPVVPPDLSALRLVSEGG